MEIRYMVATFRGAFSRHLSEPAWTSLVERLSLESAETYRERLIEATANPPETTLCFVHAGLDEPVAASIARRIGTDNRPPA
jgi:hypothetical protein